MRRALLHIDMDAFYASVEQRDDPTLRGRPVIVGGHPTRGVVLAASYEVRPFGVRSAMPMSRAVRQAPHALVVPPRFDAYADASDQVFRIFESVTPLIEPLSLDEAFLDVTASTKLFGSPAAIAAMLRERIADEVKLPASAGIAGVKFVAKIASDLAKPNGQREVPAAATRSFLGPLPVGRLWGVGPKLEVELKRLGLSTIGEVAARERAWLIDRLGEATGAHLHALSHGEDSREVTPDRGAKSVGAEDTFEEDLTGIELLLPHIHSQALRVGRRLRRAGVKTRVVQLKLKLADFTVLTRRATLPSATDDGQLIYRTAEELLRRAEPPQKVRLTGVSAQDLGDSAAAQLGLFREAPAKGDKLNEALDKIAAKYGSAAVRPADLAPDAVDEDNNLSERMGHRASKLDRKPPS